MQGYFPWSGILQGDLRPTSTLHAQIWILKSYHTTWWVPSPQKPVLIWLFRATYYTVCQCHSVLLYWFLTSRNHAGSLCVVMFFVHVCTSCAVFHLLLLLRLKDRWAQGFSSEKMTHWETILLLGLRLWMLASNFIVLVRVFTRYFRIPEVPRMFCFQQLALGHLCQVAESPFSVFTPRQQNVLWG